MAGMEEKTPALGKLSKVKGLSVRVIARWLERTKKYGPDTKDFDNRVFEAVGRVMAFKLAA